MFTLASFYRSREWERLIGTIRQERVQTDGFVYCGHCGRPIVRPYDCIGHHLTALTESNVNDYNISLNPENILLVHHKCHNTLHNKLGYASRQIYLVYGAPLSGKSTWVSQVQERGDLVVDMDNIWQCVSGHKRYEKPGRLNAVVFQIHKELLECVRLRLGKWKNAYIIGGYPLSSERERLCKSLGAREVFIDTPKQVCQERLFACEDERDKEKWEVYIEQWFDRYLPPPSPIQT